jgi:signal transduction histidine kinase
LDTKLKSYSGSKFTKIIAFVVCVVFFLVSLLGFGLVYNKAGFSHYGNSVDDVLLYDSYQNSVVFQREFQNQLGNIIYLLNQFKSEEYIKSGKSINSEQLDNAIRNLFYNGDAGSPYQGYTYSSEDGSTHSITITGEDVTAKYGSNYDDPAVKRIFIEDHKNEIEKLKQALIMDDLRSFKSLKEQLNKTKGFLYFATDGTYTLTNAAGGESIATGAALDAQQFTKAPAYLIYQNDDLIKMPASKNSKSNYVKNFDSRMESTLDEQYNPGLKVYFSFDDQYLNIKETEFEKDKSEMMRWLPMAVISALLSLASLIYLIIIAGKKDEKLEAKKYKIDKLFTEIQLAVILLLLAAGGGLFLRFLQETVTYGIHIGNGLYSSSSPLYLSIAFAILIGVFSASFGLYFILSVVRNIKTGKFLENSLVVIVISSIWRGIKSFYQGGSLMKKVVLITLGICLSSATIVLAPVAAVLIIIFAPKWIKKFEAVKKGVEEVKNGNLSYKIPADGDSELDQLARGINQISQASSVAIQNELKNQRMKTDLISNVSHDLKTPLTSIITYIDLLKQEGLDSPDALKYLEILDQKSIRLKNLTEDLFDAAKASSGAIPVKFEKVDMLSLINQGLGEMGDRIEASNLEFKVNAKNERYYVNADGQLLWRVVENLLGNVLKYAQTGSRVYIDLYEQESNAGKLTNGVLEIKNISKLELNIDADELMERFKRGDESRTTEGSGLGLAIAKDLIRLQNGLFEIKIDGDLFKAIVTLEAYRTEISED